MIDNLKEREAFEAWYADQGDRSGLYIERAWSGWQARAAIKADRVSRDVPAESELFHEVMGHLRDMQLPHGLCKPRSRMACTHCNASDRLQAIISAYRGPPVIAAHNLAASPQPQPVQAQPSNSMFDCDVVPRQLEYPLKDYYHCITAGPLHYTWQDKPHRIVYDLIAAVRFYAQPEPASQQKD